MKAPEKLLRITEVMAKTTLAESTVWDKVKKGLFPAPIKIGAMSRAWRESEVDAWIDAMQSGGSWSTKPPARNSELWAYMRDAMSHRVSRANRTIVQPGTPEVFLVQPTKPAAKKATPKKPEKRSKTSSRK